MLKIELLGMRLPESTEVARIIPAGVNPVTKLQRTGARSEEMSRYARAYLNLARARNSLIPSSA